MSIVDLLLNLKLNLELKMKKKWDIKPSKSCFSTKVKKQNRKRMNGR